MSEVGLITAKHQRLLITGNDKKTLNFLKNKFRSSGYRVIYSTTGNEAMNMVVTLKPDAMILDVVMPDMDGFELLRKIRASSDIPIIILSSLGDVKHKIEGLRAGADDYMIKPFHPDELIMRTEAVLRRPYHKEREKKMKILIGDLLINFDSQSVQKNDRVLQLTRKEWLLLSELAQNQNQLMLYSELLLKIWGIEYINDLRILRSWINRLRNKIENNPGDPSMLHTVRNFGYILTDQK